MVWFLMAAGLAAAQGIRCGPLSRRGCRWFFLLLAGVPPYVYALSCLSVARLWKLNPTGMFPSAVVEVLAYRRNMKERNTPPQGERHE